MLTNKQLSERLSYIGSSDSPGVVGVSQFQTPLYVWSIKTGQIKPEDISDKLQVKLGHKMEQTVAELFEEQTGKKVRRANETIYHKKYKFIAANIDRRVVGENSVLEIKTVSAWRKKEFNDDSVPMDMIIQVYHQLMVTGMEKGYLGILIGNEDFKIKEIFADKKALEELEKKEVHFWNTFVVPNVMPTTISKHDADTLDALFPIAKEGKEITLPEKANQLCENMEAMKEDRKNLEGIIEQNENELKALLGDAESGATSLNKIYWTNQMRKTLDSKKLKFDDIVLYNKYAKEHNIRIFKIKSLMEGQHGNTD
jgi:putative phage-type endonuclease